MLGELQGWAVDAFRCAHCLNVMPLDYRACITCGTLHGIWQAESPSATADAEEMEQQGSSSNQAASRAREPTVGPVQVEPEGAETATGTLPASLPTGAFASHYANQGIVHRAVHAEACEIPERQIEEWCKVHHESDVKAQAFLLESRPWSKPNAGDIAQHYRRWHSAPSQGHGDPRVAL